MMHHLYRVGLVILLVTISLSYSAAQIGINTDAAPPDASAILDITSTDKGILIPRMSTSERAAINNPATGLMVYDNTTQSFWYYSGTWKEIGGAFSSKNGITYAPNNDDDFVFGADSLNYGSGTENKFFFDRDRGAFRIGTINNDNWDGSNKGFYSFAAGLNTKAKGNNSVALGREVVANGYGETALGLYNTIHTPTGLYNEDRLLVIGNGESTSSRSDALIVHRNGDTRIFGSLIVGNAYTFPMTDGVANQVLSTDGNGNTTWSDNTDDQSIDSLSLNGNILTLSLENDGVAPYTVDLSQLSDITLDSFFNTGFLGYANGSSLTVDYYPGNYFFGSGTSPSWQSFTATENGLVDRLQVLLAPSPSTTYTFTLHEGEGTTGQQLASTSITNPNGNSWNNIDFSSDSIVLVAGQKYTLAFDSRRKVTYKGDNPYPGGRSGSNIDRDYFMRVYMYPSEYTLSVYNGTVQVGQNIQLNSNWLSNDGGSEGIRIDNDGNVGIGSADPSARLEIATNVNSDGVLITRNSVNDAGGIYYTYNMNTGYEAGVQADRDMGGSNNGGLQVIAANSRPIQFYVKGSQSGSGIYDTEEAMRINGDGRVGVGVDTADATLHVLGGDANVLKVETTANNRYFTVRPEGGSIDMWNSWFNLNRYSDKDVILTAGGGNVGIGSFTSSPAYKLTVNGQPAANGYTQFTNYSDRRLKHRVKDLGSTLDRITQLRPVSFQYNEKTGYDSTALATTFRGFIAQELQVIFPEMVGEIQLQGETYLDANLSALPIYLVKAMQEQQEIINQLKKKMATLEKENAALKTRTQVIQDLQRQNGVMSAILEQMQVQLDRLTHK